jgi:hypothetical protein
MVDAVIEGYNTVSLILHHGGFIDYKGENQRLYEIKKKKF